ncbi:MAG: hypothetical protein AAF570_10930, partial [Bacteroidota bacterium]
MKYRHLLFALICSILFVSPLFSQEMNPEGTWKGNIELPGIKLDIVADFLPEGDGWKGELDIPLQQAKDMKLT